jgi:hypothetical protein
MFTAKSRDGWRKFVDNLFLMKLYTIIIIIIIIIIIMEPG